MLSPSQQAHDYQVKLDELAATLGAGWRVFEWPTRLLIWRMFAWQGVPTPTQGWKIHISATVSEAIALSERVLPFLVESKVSFKVPNHIEGVRIINSGGIGETQLGKIVTIYPENDDQTEYLAKNLDALWPSTRGPFVPSDMVLHPGSAVYLRYGKFNGSEVLIDPKGYYQSAIYSPTGSLVKDERSLVGAQPDWAPPPPVACVPNTFPDIMDTVTVENDEYLPLMLLHHTPKGDVILALQLDTAQIVILKRVIPGVFGDSFGFDARDRLMNEYSLLRQLSKHRHAPQPLGISDSTHAVMAIEYVDGIFLNRLPRDEQIRSLPLFADTIARLHALGFAHNDIKLNNAVKVDGQVKLTDFELAAPLESRRKYLGGTRGYIPSEGYTERITTTADVYALGISMAHALLGVDPYSLPQKHGRLVGLLHLVGIHAGAYLLAELTEPNPQHHLSARQAEEELSRINNELLVPFNLEKKQKVSLADKRWYQRAAWESADATRQFSRTGDRGRWWKNFHFHADFQSEAINIGAAGILLGLISIDGALKRSSFGDDIFAGASWLAARPPIKTCPGLFTGDAGVALALAMAGKRLARQEFIDAARSRLFACETPGMELDLYTGGAGVLLTACLLADLLDSEWPLEWVAPIADRLLTNAREVEGVIVWNPRWDPETSSSLYTGAAHGSAGIAMALAHWGKLTRSKQSCDIAFETFQSLYKYARNSIGTALKRTAGSHSEGEPNGYWCHGLAGYLWCMLYAFGDESALREEIDWAVHGFSAAAPIDNPTYCHGLAGQLELWRMLMALPRYQKTATNRAAMVAKALRLQSVRIEGKCVWYSEDPFTLTPDLWIGFLGPASALALYAYGTQEPLISSSWLKLCCQSAQR
jgi:serine/threonine protein kinase